MDTSSTQMAVNPAKLFVGNLSWNLRTEDLQELFAQHGTVVDCIVMNDRFTGRSKGFGFVTMSSADEANKAVEALNNQEIDGRAIVVNVAQPPRPREDRPRYDSRGGGGGGDRGGSDRRSSGGGSRRSY